MSTLNATISVETLKRVIGVLAAIGADALGINADRDNVLFLSWYDSSDPRHYDVEVDCLTEYLDDAQALYSIDYLVGIADCIQPNDMIFVGLGVDRPIEIRYVVDGCEIQHILAPRIEV